MAAFNKRLIGEISNARERGEFTDFVLLCGGERFPVHKVIVCSHSKVLHAACRKPFREAALGEYEITDQSPEMVRRMVDYFYTGDYKGHDEPPEEPSKEKPESSEAENLTALRVHARMFALAHMYQVDHLQALAASKYGKEWEKTKNFQHLLDSIPDVYQLTPSSVRALRDKVIVALRAWLGRTRRPSWYGEPSEGETPGAADALMAAYDDIAAEYPEFLKDLFNSFVRGPILAACHNCGTEPPQPAEVLQAKCLTCGKGGARPL
ncbi:hypothetical protein VTH82DRAFT_8360 [Thermothelomyces myriococcoides]